jgi:hypothetical protein
VQKLHRKVDTFEFTAFNGQITRLGCAAAQNHRIEFLQQLIGGVIFAYFGVGDKGNAFGSHQIYPALDHLLIQFHVGNAVHQQTADAVGPLEDVTRWLCVELSGARPAGLGPPPLPFAGSFGGVAISNLKTFVDDGAHNADGDRRL